MKILIFTILLFGTFLIAPQAEAVWTYEQKFNALDDGELHGQDSWDGSVEWNVQTTVKYEGAKGLYCVTGKDAYISRAITGVSAGTVYGAMRVSAAPTGTSDLRFILGAWTMYTVMRTNNKISYQVSGTGYVDYQDFVAGQWYILAMEFDDSAHDNEYRVNVYDVTEESWGGWTDWVASAAYTSIASVGLYGDTLSGYTGYFDMITPTNPFPVATDTCTCPTDGSDWYINSSDSCYLSTNCDLDSGGLYLLNTGEGGFNIIDGAELSVSKIESTSTPINVENGCKINFK